LKKAKSFSIHHSNYTFIIVLFLFLATLLNSCDRPPTECKGAKNPQIEYLTTRDGKSAIQIYNVLYIVIDDCDKRIPALCEQKDFDTVEKNTSTLLSSKNDEAKAYESNDCWQTIEKIYNDFFVKHPEDIRGRFFYAYHAYKAKKNDIAYEQFEVIGDQWMEGTPWGSLVEYNYSRARTYIFKGENLLLEKKLYQLSIDFWRKAVRCNPDDCSYFRLGQAYMYTGISKWNLSYMLIGEEMLTKAIEYKGPSSKYAEEELKKLRDTIKQYGKITIHRVSDEAGILPKYDARRFEEQLGWIFDESDIDIRFVFVKDTGSKTIEQLAVEKVQELGIGGKSREERGILLLYDLKDKELRVEVGYGLEQYFPDAFVGYLVHYHARDFFSGGDLAIGLQWLIRMLHHRIREQTLGNNFDPRIVEVIRKQGYLSGGAGVSAYVPADGKNQALFLSKLEDKERRYYCAQPTPKAVYGKFLTWLAVGKFDPKIEIFTQQSQIYLSSLPVTKAYFHYILMQEYGRSYNFYIKDNLALQYFSDDPLVVPRCYIRTSAGWQMDIMAELRNSRNRVGCIYTWDYAGISDMYTKAFADKLVNIKNYIRIKDGDNRELPLRNSPQ
jgi:hypothetical protein